MIISLNNLASLMLYVYWEQNQDRIMYVLNLKTKKKLQTFSFWRVELKWNKNAPLHFDRKNLISATHP